MSHYLKKELYELVKKDERIFDFLQEGSLDGLWYWDLEKPENEWMNARFWNVLGYDPKEMPHLSSAWQDIINQDDLKVAIDNFHKHVEDPNHPYDQVVRYTHKKGHTVWVRCRGIAIRDEKGNAFRMLGAHQDITKEKEAIEKLSSNEARYKQLIETASDAIYMIDENGVIIDTNQSATQMLQRTKDEIIGNEIDTVDPNFPTSSFIEFWKEVPVGEQRIFETTHITKNGTLIPIEISGKRFIIDKKTYYYGIARDLTERKKTIHALTESEEKFRSIFEFANIGIALADEKGIQIDVNNEFLQKLGYTREEFFGFNFNDFSHPDDNEKELPFVKEILAGNIDYYRVTKRLRKKDGQYLWFDISVTALKNEKGKIDMFFAMAIDITEQKLAVEETTILADMLNTAPNSITIHDEDGNFLFANERTFELHGYEPEEYMALSLKEIDVPESAELRQKRIQTIKENGYGAFEVEHYKKDGSRVPLDIYVKPVNWKGSLALMSIATDISDRKKWIQELVDAKEKAEEANRLKTEFLNNMSHEIRTPMNGIMGFSEMLGKEDITLEKRKYFSRIVQNSSRQLLRIIDDILEISTLETKQDKPIEAQFSLNDLIMELFSIFNLNAQERSIPIYVKKELPDDQSFIISDKSKLNKILSNLLENALKFTNKGFIEIGYTLKDENLIVYVKDSGIGISPENQEIIFERFSQEHKEISRKHGGLGLGLSISKENAMLLGGDITVKSEKGKGSTFFLTIPYKSTQNSTDSKRTSSDSDIEEKEKLTILVAEDEEVNYFYIETLFEEYTAGNITLIHAINGREAVDICLNNTIDLVLMDIKMPIMGGLEATKNIKSKFPQLPVIAQTAYSTEADRQLAIEHGCDDFISKPIKQENFFEIIKQHINIG